MEKSEFVDSELVLESDEQDNIIMLIEFKYLQVIFKIARTKYQISF